MMGHSHAISGAAIYAALTAQGPLGLNLMPATPQAWILGTLIAAGAALLPDWDHPQATISRSLPPLSNLAAHGIQAISGGHRRNTHTLVGIGAATLLTLGLSQIHAPIGGTSTALGSGIVACVLVTLAAKALRLLPHDGYIANWAIGIGAGTLVALTPAPHPLWLAAAVAVGYTVHLAGDAITTGRIKPLLPFSDAEVGLPVLGNTGSWREHLLTTALALYVAATLYTTARPLLHELTTNLANFPHP